MNNIVVGVSGAVTSQIAGRYAFELAEKYGASVHVVTAVDPADPEVFDVGADRFVLSGLEAAYRHVTAFVETIGTSVEWKVHVLDLKPARALLQVAEQTNADLIVVGNVGMQGIGRVVGSVGNDVVHHAPCNVLVVKTT